MYGHTVLNLFIFKEMWSLPCNDGKQILSKVVNQCSACSQQKIYPFPTAKCLNNLIVNLVYSVTTGCSRIRS